MGQIVSDDFNRADAGTLGANWTNVSAANLQVSGNIATLATDNFGLCTYTGAAWTGGNDQYAEAAVVLLQSGKDMGIVVRSTGTYFSTDSCYLAIINSLDAAVALGSSMRLQLTKSVSNTFTDITNVDMVISANDVIRLEANGTTIRILVNGVVKISVTDSSVTTGNPGIFISSGAVNGSKWDNFAAGDFAGAGAAFAVDRPRGNKRPFPFLPGSPQQRM